MTDPTEAGDSPELRQLSAELRLLEAEQRRRELERAKDLDPIEREHRKEEMRALRLDNQTKRWTRVGLLVAWIATLVPIWISVHEYWNEREEAAKEERRAAAAERMATIQDAMRRYTDGSDTAAFELPLYPEGVSFLVGQLEWDVEGPDTEGEIEKVRAALIALQSASVELTDDQVELLCEEREQLLDRLEDLAGRWESGRDEVGEQGTFLAQYEIHRRLRRLLGGERDDCTGEIAESGSPASREATIEETYRHILEASRG